MTIPSAEFIKQCRPKRRRNRLPHPFTGWSVAFMLVLCQSLASGRDRHESDGTSRNAAEPTVTRTEYQLIQNALATAATNETRALEMLTGANNPAASAALDFSVGNILVQAGQLEKAVQAYEAALAKAPKFRAAKVNLGKVYLRLNEVEKAIDVYLQLIADGHADADGLTLLGHAMLLGNNPVSSETAYRNALLLRPRDRDAMTGLVKALFRQDRFQEGIALAGELLAANPQSHDIWALAVNAHLAMGAHEHALLAIEKARRLGCADPEMLATLGDLLLNRNQPEDAMKAYVEAFGAETKPYPARLLRASESLLLLGKHLEAERLLEMADTRLREAPETFTQNERVTMLRLKAEVSRIKNRPDEALAFCRQALQINPLDAKTLLAVADIQHAAGRDEEAVMACEQAARIQGSEAEALVKQALIEVSRNHYAKAIPLLEAAQVFQEQPHVARYLEQIRHLADQTR